MSDISALLADARLDRAGDVEALADMTEDQITYLLMLEYLPDPATDGVECDSETRERH